MENVEDLLDEVILKNECLQDEDTIDQYARYITNDRTMEAVIFLYDKLNLTVKRIEGFTTLLKDILTADLGEEKEKNYGLNRLYWLEQNRKGFNTDKFKAEHPDLYEEYKTEKLVKVFKIGGLK